MISPRLITTCLRLCVAALVVEVVSCCIPGWFITDFDTSYIKVFRNYAVFYIYECQLKKQEGLLNLFHPEQEVCTTESYVTKLQERREKIIDAPVWDYAFTGEDVMRWETMTCIGIVCEVVATGLLFKIRHYNMQAAGSNPDPGIPLPSRHQFVAPAIISAISGFNFSYCVYMVACGFRPNYNMSESELPYGSIIAGFGAFLAFCCTALTMFVCIRYRRDEFRGIVLRSADVRSGQSIPMMPMQGHGVGQHCPIGQPTLEQPPMGQPHMGQSHMGLPPMGQPHVGQPPFEQPPPPYESLEGFAYSTQWP